MEYGLTPIAVVESCFKQKFGIPRQSGLASAAQAVIKMLPPFDDPEALTGLEHCSHIWLQFIFHQNKHSDWRARVRPPRLGGNKSIGVFATRSPYRPNALGLSVVKLERVELGGAPRLIVSGVDLLDGTPVVDIKPYVPYCDAVAGASNSLAAAAPESLPVVFTPACQTQLRHMPEARAQMLHTLITQTLQLDPRPSYQALDESRIYGTVLDGAEVKWCYKSQRGNIEIHVLSAAI